MLFVFGMASRVTVGTAAQVAEQLAEDEDYLQRADHFEASYNFRFQASAGYIDRSKPQ